MKWEPIAAMLALLALGIWLVAGKSPADLHGIATTPGATVQEFRIANQRGVIETIPPGTIHSDLSDDPAGEPGFRVLLRNGHASPVLSAAEFRAQYGDEAYQHAIGNGGNLVFRLLNITSWVGVVWVAIGFAGQAAFFGRMMLQWMVSEKKRQSVVPEAFWWLSLVGGVMLFTYFVWRQDIVGVLGQTSGVVIYARNIRLIHKHRRRAARRSAEAAPLTRASAAG